MQFIPSMAVALALDFSLPMFAISHEHELGCYRAPVLFSLSALLSSTPNDFCSSQCLVSSVGPLPSIASMVLSQLRPACSSHVPVNASSSFKDNPLPIPLWYSCGYRSLEKFC